MGLGVCHLRAWEGGSDGDYLGSTKGLRRWFGGKESACQAVDMGLIPESARSPGEGNATCSNILAWEIPWKEEPGRLQSMGSQKSQT